MAPAGPMPGIAGCENGQCGPPGRFWVGAEYLFWSTKNDNVPPLVTTGTPPGTGVLGQPGTSVLFGGDIDYGTRQGARLTAGMWLNDAQTKGIEFSTFWLCRDDDDFAASSNGSPLIARPFFDTATGTQGSQLVAFPGLLAGSVDVESSSWLKGCEVNAICNLCCCYRCDAGCGAGCHDGFNCRGGRLDLLVGLRYLELREELTVTENLTVPAGVPLVGVFPNIGGLPLVGGDRFGVRDQFRTENRFYGGQVGLRGEYAFGGGLFVNATGKIALGVMEQTVDIEGSSTVVTPAGSVVAPGGLLAQSTNIGRYNSSEFAVVPELTLNVGYQVNRNLRVFAGYTYLAVSDVVRPGDVVDFSINSTRVPTSLAPAAGAARPTFISRDSNFWAQGFSLGAELRY